MLHIRSLAFNLVFYLNLIVQMILWTPYYFLSPRHRAWFVPKFWSRTSMWLYDKIANTKSEITGRENLPEGSFILAPKHQSFWDTIAFLPFLRDPVFILKRELTWIPFFGWYILKMRMIPVDRGSRSKALKIVVAATRQEMARNPRQLIIYPELQIWHRRTLCAAWRSRGAGRPCCRTLLAAPEIPALSRHDQGTLPAADSAGPWQGRIHATADRRDGSRLRPVAHRGVTRAEPAAYAANGGEKAWRVGGGSGRLISMHVAQKCAAVLR
jgi:1-acyl-sn-glycerol-3-phosphate acyltransferase